MTCSNIVTSPFWGVCFFNERLRAIYSSNLEYSIDIHEINMSSNTCHIHCLRDTHAEKTNTPINSDP